MIAFPLPMLTFLLAVFAAFFVSRIDTGVRRTNLLLRLFFVLIAAGSLLVGLRFGYGVQGLIPFQRVIPLFVGPCLYLAFLGLAVGGRRYRTAQMVHFAIAVCGAVLSILTAAHMGYLDGFIGLSYLVYAAALLLLWSKGINHLSQARIELVASLRWWMLAAAALLIIFLIGDTAIALSFAFQRPDSTLSLLSGSAVVMVVLLLMTLFAIAAGRARHTTPHRSAPDPHADPLEQRARAFLEETKLYLDTDLSIDRLAKRLHVPTRNLSLAINQSCGMNVSQYVNDFRLDHAAALLVNGEESVAQVMEQSGFLTRSNFYRTFQSKFGMSPAAYRDQRQPAP
ncbi:MAG: helix-turn-helix domain-containing protein [Sulfitobacter sp.]